MKKKILISTGGSGGHIIPAEIIDEHLKSNYDVVISTDLRGHKYLNKDLYNILMINTPKLKFDVLLIYRLYKLILLTLKSFFYLKKNKINKIFSTGGYMSLPVCLGGKLLGLEIYLLEPNYVLGRANKFFLNFAKKIFCYTNKLKNFPKKFEEKIQIIPPLVKKKFYEKKPLINHKDIFCFLVVGGSQGAKIFENIIHPVIIKLSQKHKIKIIQQTRIDNIDNLRSIYNKNDIENKIFNFEKDFTDLIHQSDLCITRAGASTLSELSVMNKPFLAVPLHSSKDNHQFENADFYYNLNCCWIINQIDFNKERLEIFLDKLLTDKTDYLNKKINLEKLNYHNSWNNVNQKLIETIDEN